jgi:hypothetical protein
MTADRILRFHAELVRLRTLKNASAYQFQSVYLERTMRSLCTELAKLRAVGKGPGYIVGHGTNRKVAYIYDVEEVLAFFGGEAALFDKRDRLEIFSEKAGRVIVKPRRAA